MQQASSLTQEAARMMTICNACRYCEGYCAVFPAMERRLDFASGDLNYLANLCHDCGECYYACQYAPPHEFGIDIPRVLAGVRIASYEQYAWPAPLGPAFRNGGAAAAAILAVVFVAVLFAAMAGPGSGRLLAPIAGGDFYQLVSHRAMAGAFGAVGLFVAAALVVGLRRFWRDAGESSAGFVEPLALREALREALGLRNLHGSGADCTSAGEEQRSPWRRWFHHLTFYGFLLCFAATAVATIYHYAFGRPAPYAYTSLPVLLGTLGGIGLVIGPVGLYWLGRKRDPATSRPTGRGLDIAFIALLVATSTTGLLLLALRETAAMGLLLVVHLGVVLALFVTLPYGKFVHGVYRAAALVKFARERTRPRANLGAED